MKRFQERRDCLKLGLGGIFGGLSGILQAQAATPLGQPAAGATNQAKACILIWLDGGPTHYETFDPKPSAPGGDSRRIRDSAYQCERRPLFGASTSAGTATGSLHGDSFDSP